MKRRDFLQKGTLVASIAGSHQFFSPFVEAEEKATKAVQEKNGRPTKHRFSNS